MKYLAQVVLILTAVSLGCNGACNVQPSGGPFTVPPQQPFKYRHSNLDKRTSALIKYMSKRSVRIRCMKILVEKDTGILLGRHKKCGWGTGTIIRSYKGASYILTANHVVSLDREDSLFYNNAEWVYYYLIERRSLKNKVINTYGGSIVVRRDTERDVAVLEIPYNLNIQTAISHNVVLGQEAHVLGYPWLPNISGSHLSYTHGYIGTMYLGNDKTKRRKQHDRIDMDVYMGNSGSAVFDNNGRIVGMINWVTGMRLYGGYFLPQPKQTYGCSARGLIDFLNNTGKIELSKF